MCVTRAVVILRDPKDPARQGLPGVLGEKMIRITTVVGRGRTPGSEDASLGPKLSSKLFKRRGLQAKSVFIQPPPPARPKQKTLAKELKARPHWPSTPVEARANHNFASPSSFLPSLTSSPPRPSPPPPPPSTAQRRGQRDRPVMLAGFQLSAQLRLRSLRQSGWEKGKFAKPRVPSPGEATKKLQHQQRLTSCGAAAQGPSVGSRGRAHRRTPRGPPPSPDPRPARWHLSAARRAPALPPVR